MFNNMLMRTKLGLGFGILILIAMIVGGVAVMKMRAAESDSKKLSQEYVPEAKDASDLESRAYRTMYMMRGYTYTGDKKFLDAGMDALAQVKETIGMAEQLATKAIHLTKLKDSLADIKKNVTEYEKQAGLTVEKRKDLEKTATDMNANANDYTESALTLYKSQSAAMAKEIKDAASAEKLGERLVKLTLVTELLNQGNNARITNLQARARNDFTIMKEGIAKVFPEIEKAIKELQPITRLEVDKKELADITTAADHYKTDMQQYLTLSDELNKLNSARGATADQVLELAHNLMKAATDKTNEIATEATVNLSAASITVIVGLVVALLIGIILTVVITRAITIPLSKAVGIADELSKGNLTVSAKTESKDETGQLLNAMDTMAGNLRVMFTDISRGVETLSSSSIDLAAVSKQLSSAARDTADKSSTVAVATEEMSTNIQSVSAAMEQSSANVNMVASSTEEMTATVNEIAQSAEKARSISEGAVKQSRFASEKMAILGESARKIGRVTETITDISEQTNLLALNATIEAARAGEAGKGFAVVANEIKELARQTAAATIDIKNQIEEMQDTTATTVADIEKISGVIAEINNVINGIATAVEEQSAASSEIANNISQASQGIAEVNESVAQSTVVVADITRDIAGINQQSSQVGDGSRQVQTSAQGLSELAAQLENLVKRFRVA